MRREKSPSLMAPQPAVTLGDHWHTQREGFGQGLSRLCVPAVINPPQAQLGDSLHGGSPRRHCTHNQCLEAIGSLQQEKPSSASSLCPICHAQMPAIFRNPLFLLFSRVTSGVLQKKSWLSCANCHSPFLSCSPGAGPSSNGHCWRLG